MVKCIPIRMVLAGLASLMLTCSQTAASDQGWTSPWLIAPRSAGYENQILTQSEIASEGAMGARFDTWLMVEREFPRVTSGILKIEMSIRGDEVSHGVFDAACSMIKFYVFEARDKGRNCALRWHFPFAWPGVGGNDIPQFYVIDGAGRKRKGLEFTGIEFEAGRWYKTTTVLNLDKKTWEFWVDGQKFDAPRILGHEMTWWQHPKGVGRIGINAGVLHTIWFDSIRIWHNDELIANCGFEHREGYVDGASLIDQPGNDAKPLPKKPDPRENYGSPQGWTSPWTLVRQGHRGDAAKLTPQEQIAADGSMSLEMRGSAIIERCFPLVKAGILKVQMRVRPDKTTSDINDRDSASILKVHITDENGREAIRLHYPFAWPAIGGQAMPQFYVVDGRGNKRRGVEFTGMKVEAGRWFQIVAILNLNEKTWQLHVDGKRFDAPRILGHEMAWQKGPTTLGRLRISNAGTQTNWVDSIRITHNDRVIASTGFESDEGCLVGKPILDTP